MRTFNPEKELNKIQKGNKNKIILGVISLLLVITIGSSYALYQIRYNKRIIYTTVDKFYSKDIQISLYVDGKKDTTSETFPGKESGKIFSHITCENGSSGVFDNTKWELSLKITKQDKCNVYFITGNLPNPPELYQGMIPVTYDNDGNVYVANVTSDWYNYQDHRWGNAVLVDASNPEIKAKYFNETELRDDIAGEQISIEEILQMYVWIPRYKYQLFNVGLSGTPKQIINIKFEKGTETTGDITCKYTNEGNGEITESCLNKEGEEASKGEWYTHPAFTFKGTTEESGTELPGIWVGKFESSDPTSENGRKNGNNINEVTILPNKTSLIGTDVSTEFYATRKIEEENTSIYNLNSVEIDTHMMKNIEWGAVAYLTQSMYGIYKNESTCNIEGMDFNECEVWINNTVQGAGKTGSVTNNYGGTATGCVGDTVSGLFRWSNDDGLPANCPDGKKWNQNGIKSSTTGNMYGVYDMSGGAFDRVMSAIVTQSNGELYISRTGFQTNTLPESKYYDMYTFSDENFTYERGHLGDATRETLLIFGNTKGGWNLDYAYFPYVTPSFWFNRGGGYGEGRAAGIFSLYAGEGGLNFYGSFRVVLTAQ